MRAYELMIILDPEVDDRNIAPTLDRFLKVVKDAGGTIENVDIWGKRRLAYEINKRSEGVYAVINMTTEPDVAKELDRQLGLSESVLRTKLLRPDPKALARRAAADAKRAAADARRPRPDSKPGRPDAG